MGQRVTQQYLSSLNDPVIISRNLLHVQRHMLFNLLPSILNLTPPPQQNEHCTSSRPLYEAAFVQPECISITKTPTLSVYIPDNTYVIRTNKTHTLYCNLLFNYIFFDVSNIHVIFLCVRFRVSLNYGSNCPTKFNTNQSIY